jgi:hypothetical protein
MKASLNAYLLIVHKMSNRLRHQIDKRTSKLPEGLQYLAYAGYQFSSGCCRVRLSAVETSSVSGRQMAQPYWKVLMVLFCVWRKVPPI